MARHFTSFSNESLILWTFFFSRFFLCFERFIGPIKLKEIFDASLEIHFGKFILWLNNLNVREHLNFWNCNITHFHISTKNFPITFRCTLHFRRVSPITNAHHKLGHLEGIWDSDSAYITSYEDIKLSIVGCTCMSQVVRGVEIFNLYRDKICILMV